MKQKYRDWLFAIIDCLIWAAAGAILMWVFSNDADAEEKKKEPKIDHVYSLITWYKPRVPPYTNEFIWKTERRCLKFRARINGILESSKDDPKFGWIGECTKRSY